MVWYGIGNTQPICRCLFISINELQHGRWCFPNIHVLNSLTPVGFNKTKKFWSWGGESSSYIDKHTQTTSHHLKRPFQVYLKLYLQGSHKHKITHQVGAWLQLLLTMYPHRQTISSQTFSIAAYNVGHMDKHYQTHKSSKPFIKLEQNSNLLLTM